MPKRSHYLSELGWLCMAIGLVALVAFIALVISLYHTSQGFHVNGIPLDDTNAQLYGTFDFQCQASRLHYSLTYAVPPAETVTRLRLEFRTDVGPNPPDAIPLCQNPTLDPINPYGGPICPSEVPCVGKACYEGVLSSSQPNTLTIEKGYCKQLAKTETLLLIRLYTDMHPDGILVGSMVRHATT